MREIESLVRIFKALGDDTRLRLVQLLSTQRGGNALCVTRLAAELNVTPSSISQHLRILKDLGLVQSERHGYQIHYWLDVDRLGEYRDLARQELGDAFADLMTWDHSQEEDVMCGCGCGSGECKCEHPERQEGQGTQCTPEQIRECHGDAEGHPCKAEQTED